MSISMIYDIASETTIYIHIGQSNGNYSIYWGYGNSDNYTSSEIFVT